MGLLGKPTILGNPHITSPTRGPFFHCSAMVCRNFTRTRLRNGDRLHLCQGFSQHHVTLGTRKPRGQLTVEIRRWSIAYDKGRVSPLKNLHAIQKLVIWG